VRSIKSTFILSILIGLLAAPIVIGLGMVVFKWSRGYYPVPAGVKLIYYSFKYQSSHRVEQVVDNKFKIGTNGYTTEYALKNMISVPYYVYIKFNPKTEPVPTSYQYTGTLKIDITRDNKVQYSHITDVILKNNLGALGAKSYRNGFTDGYYVAVLPFPLNNGTYDNTKINITVINVDNKLKAYVDDVQVTIVPKIDLDSDVSGYTGNR
jgi:hypothetical protein